MNPKTPKNDGDRSFKTLPTGSCQLPLRASLQKPGLSTRSEVVENSHSEEDKNGNDDDDEGGVGDDDDDGVY